MKLAISRSRGAWLALALALPLAGTLLSGAMASSPATLATAPGWTVKKGPDVSSKPWPDGGTHPTVTWEGEIDPPLGPGQGGTISKVVFVCNPGTDEEIPVESFMGAANGASFTIHIKQSALAGKGCSKELKVSYDMHNGTEYVTVFKPTAFVIATLDYGAWPELPPYEVEFPVRVVSHLGTPTGSYFGEVVVSVTSQGGGVKLNGTWGQAVVQIEEGLGTLRVDASSVPSGGRITFDLSGARLDSYRTSIERQ